MIDYIVKFCAGSIVRNIHVSANSEEQAKELARIQAKYGQKLAGRFEVLYIWKEGEQDPSIKELDKYRHP